MIGWHTADGWLAPEVRTGPFFAAVQAFGGLAAPLFLLVSGGAVALALERSSDRSSATRKVIARGAGLVLLGYALRLQFWLFDSLGVLRPAGPLVLALAAAGLAFALPGLGRIGRSAGGVVPACAGVLLVGTSLVVLGEAAPTRLAGALRVDVLHAIGASIAIVAIVWRRRSRPAVALLLALVVASLAPALARALPTSLAPALADYVAARPSAVAFFPLAPWLAYAFVGAAFGTFYARSLTSRARTPVATRSVLAAIVCVLVTHEALPLGGALAATLPDLVELQRLASHAAVALVLLHVLHGVRGRLPILDVLGRSSLLVYWSHLTFAFGILSRPFHDALAPAEWIAGAIALVALAWAIAQIRTGISDALRRSTSSREEIRSTPLSRTGALL